MFYQTGTTLFTGVQFFYTNGVTFIAVASAINFYNMVVVRLSFEELMINLKGYFNVKQGPKRLTISRIRERWRL